MTLTPLLRDWTPAQKADFLAAPVVFEHRMADSGLFTDEALIALADGYPGDAIDINLYDFDDEGQVTLRTGERGGANGAALIEAAHKGRLWLNFLQVMDRAPAIRALAQQALDEIRGFRPDFRPRKMWGQLIVSSPAVKVPYHADPSGVVLFHIAGKKRIYIYPNDEAHAPEREIEKILTRQQTEELPYRRDMDRAAAVFDLEPGMAVAWPLHAPHRIENLSSFCVSLSVDYQTLSSQMLNAAMVTNAALRRIGMSPPLAKALPAPVQALSMAASIAIRASGVIPNKMKSIPRDFVMDPNAEDGANLKRRAQAVGTQTESR